MYKKHAFMFFYSRVFFFILVRAKLNRFVSVTRFYVFASFIHCAVLVQSLTLSC